MKEIVSTPEEAQEWFLRNSSGTVICERADGTQLEVDCYPDALAFFESSN